MKRLIITIGLVLFICGLAAAQVSRGGTLYVATKTVELKASTGVFARTNATLNYGDRVTVLSVDGKWVEVRSVSSPSLTGWTASANMTAKQVVAGSTTTATAWEVALAGKGFNQEVEDSFRAQQNLNYADVDRVEAITVDLNVLRRFLEEGRLSLGDN
jgi:uncharacterized protein YgiM (DUF1202 family)